MAFDVYQLCDLKHNKGSIRAVMNWELRERISESLRKLKQQGMGMNVIASKLGIDYTTLCKHVNKDDGVSLSILRYLEKNTDINFSSAVRDLRYGQQKSIVRFPQTISEDLAKISGALLADGHLSHRSTKDGYRYDIVVREGYKSNMDALCKWITNTFSINVKHKKLDNHYYLYISNKILFKFFNAIIGIPYGNKSRIICVPECVKNANKNIQKCFLRGVFMFDGGVDYRTGYVDMISVSSTFIKEIVILLKEMNLDPDYTCLIPDKLGRYKLRFRKHEKIEKCLQLFEENTEKWNRLNEHLYGLSAKSKDLKTALKSFDTYYPRVRKSSITFSDVMKAVNNTRPRDVYSISKTLQRKYTVVNEFLHKLERWDVLTSSRIGQKKVYEFAAQLKMPRRY